LRRVRRLALVFGVWKALNVAHGAADDRAGG